MDRQCELAFRIIFVKTTSAAKPSHGSTKKPYYLADVITMDLNRALCSSINSKQLKHECSEKLFLENVQFRDISDHTKYFTWFLDNNPKSVLFLPTLM